MKKRTVKTMLALLLTTAMVAMTACGQQPQKQGASESESGSENTEASAEVSSKNNNGKLPTISLYPMNANLTSGLVTGEKGEFFAENGFQLEVWAYSDEKTNAILASGDLPDIMYVSRENLDTMIEAGMLLNLEDYLDELPHLYSSPYMEGALELARETATAETGDLYGLPIWVGKNTATSAWADSTDRHALKLRWDVYEEIGAPEINDYWELIDVMEQMLQAHPEEEDGTPCYGTVLNSGSDTTYWGNINLWYAWQGYYGDRLPYLIEKNMVDGTYSSILTKDSKYYEGLKWYNEVYRRGLMDPDSINTDRGTQAPKIDAGLAMVPSGTLPGWSPIYYEYYISGTQIWYDAIEETGYTSSVVAINANTEHLEECLALLDIWCNPDAALTVLYGLDGGGIWYSEGNNAYISGEFSEYLKENGTHQGYKLESGEEWSLFNTPFCILFGEDTTYTDGNGETRPSWVLNWTEVKEIVNVNDTFASWQETTGHTDWREWLTEENALYETSPFDNVESYLEEADEKMQLTIDSIKNIVVNASWQMVYSETTEEFESIWDQMVKDCEGLGAEDLINWASENYDNAFAKKAAVQK